MINATVQLAYKNSAWFTANSATILAAGRPVFLSGTRTFKVGDGVTALSALPFYDCSGGTGNFVPYTGATADVDLDTFSLNAKSLHVKGTGGNGSVGLKHQSANITANGGESSVGANSSGNPVWKNDGNPLQYILLKDAAQVADIVGLQNSLNTIFARPVTQGVQDNIVTFDRDGNANDSGSAITLVTGAAQKSANLSDLANAATARTNIDAQQTISVSTITPAIDDTIRARDTSNANADGTFSIREMFLERGEVRMRYGFEFYTDFINLVSTTGSDGAMAATVSGTGAAITQQGSDTQNIVGVARASTGTTATGRSAISTSTNIIRLGGGVWYCEAYVNITTLSTITERFQKAVGFIDTLTAANQVDGVYFLYDEGGVSTGSAASLNWQIVTVSNSVRTFTTTATAVAAATWVRLTIIVNAAGTSVTFYINGTSAGTHTTNIPTASGRAVGVGSLLVKSIGTTARTVDYDYVVALADYTTPKT